MMETDEPIIGPLNLGNPGEFTMFELAEKVVQTTGSSSEIIFQELPQDDPKQRQPDITKARETLEWEPTIALDEGLTRTVDCFRMRLLELVDV